jgi:YVTN family beta-propeller protein
MRSINKTGYFRTLKQVWLLQVMLLMALPLSARTARIYVTNHAGDTIDVIDPMTDKIVQVIKGIELPHDIGFSLDGRQLYITTESENVLDVVDQKSGTITKKVPLSGRPNTLAVTNDGKRVFVAIAEKPGGLDVIDTTSLERIKTIPTEGRLHDIYLTPDGKYVVAGSEGERFLKVVDVQTEQPIWEIKFENRTGVRTMAIEANPDGSTSRIFVNLGELHGFAVVDFATHKEVDRIMLPGEPRGFYVPGSSGNICHGIGIAPDGKTLWANSKNSKGVFVYSLPDLQLLGHARTGMVPEWITFSPDSKKVYVSNEADNTVSVIDGKTLKQVALIPVGQSPERNRTLVLP